MLGAEKKLHEEKQDLAYPWIWVRVSSRNDVMAVLL